jgi:poly [ADP-ribose] polymerase
MTNSSPGTTILNAYKVTRWEEVDRFKKFQGNQGVGVTNYLLWHGSRVSNFLGILSEGLRIAPPEAPVSGYAFGKVRTTTTFPL